MDQQVAVPSLESSMDDCSSFHTHLLADLVSGVIPIMTWQTRADAAGCFATPPHSSDSEFASFVGFWLKD